MKIRDYLSKRRVICDGAFGSYFAAISGDDMLPERANTQLPELVKKVHKDYIDAGAVLLRTNTFASNKKSLNCNDRALVENIQGAWRNAAEAVRECGREAGQDCFIAGDIGPISRRIDMGEEDTQEEYKLICNAHIKAGAEILIFETFTDIDEILPVIEDVKKKQDIFIIVQFCVNQYGYSNTGVSAARLFKEAGAADEIDAIGFNCGVGPGHLKEILSKVELPEGKYITALPNAGYPKRIENRMVFQDNAEYFVQKISEIALLGIEFLGGCCGTTPEYIRQVNNSVDISLKPRRIPAHKENKIITPQETDSSFWKNKRKGEKLIAVELSPPPGANDDKVMEAAYRLKNKNVDVLTFPDSPSGRTRADSVLMSMKAAKETNLCVMPHLCCRDKNAIGMQSQLLGAYINGIRNMLIITGDPVPTLIRQEVKSVFNFDSVGLMRIISQLNQEEFRKDPVVFGGAVNHNRHNIEIEIGRVKKKMLQGASFFLTQPVFTKQEAEKLQYIKAQTGARILCGVMPLVSLRNAMFIKNEMAGINVTEEIAGRFRDNMTREEGEETGLEIAKEVMGFTEDFVDGYYFSIPFNRVYLLEKLL